MSILMGESFYKFNPLMRTKIVNLLLFAAIERNNLMRLSQTIPFTPIQLFGECHFYLLEGLYQGKGKTSE